MAAPNAHALRPLVAALLAGGALVPTWPAAAPAPAPAPPAVTSATASTHPMRYHVSPPQGWTADRDWPVLVVIPDAARDFEANLQRFAAVRGPRPYILVAPEVLTSGGARTHTRAYFSYSQAVWDSLLGHDEFAFDDAGVAAVLADVHRRWRGETRAFLTGWEAGGHTVWALALRHPERWRGVAPATTNYQRRGLQPSDFSHAPERANLPIQVLIAGAPADDVAAAAATFTAQTETALADARAHGFSPRPPRVVPGAPHGPLAEAVLAWCDSLRAAR